LGEVEVRDEFADRSITVKQEIQDLPAVRLREDVKGDCHAG
jgi:hypothetical protein